MPTLTPNPAAIIVPRHHGQILIEPPMPALLAAPNVFPDAPEADFLGIPRWVVAETARGEWLEAINTHARAIGAPELPRSVEEAPWIITGHQLEFYHAGVWAKAIAAAHIARRRQGLAIDILVDHDIITELGFAVPTRDAESRWTRTEVTYGQSPNLPADALASPTIEQFEHWDSELGDLPAAQSDTLAHILTDLRPRPAAAHSIFAAPAPYPATGEGADEPFTVWMSRARHKLQTALDLPIAHVPASLLCSGSTWLLFVLAWVRNAEAWTASYNRQLAAYRARAGIKSAMHPMPDLARRQVSQQRGGYWEIELPFWIYAPGESRTRLQIRLTAGETPTTELLLESETIDLAGCLQASAWDSVQALKKILRQSNLILRPRALTLTMYTRLFLADLFIHGIGGALYDQITDAIMLELFNIATPYACISAAWLLPLGQPGDDIPTPSEIRHQRHHLLHNPQRGIDPFTSLRTEIAELLRDRRELVESLNDSIKFRRQSEKAERKEMFHRLRATNAALHEKVPKILRRLDEDLVIAKEQARENAALSWREYYFALHTTESLKTLIQKITKE